MPSQYNETRSQAEKRNNRLLNLIYAQFKRRLQREFKRTYTEAIKAYDKNKSVPRSIYDDHEKRLKSIILNLIFKAMNSGSQRLINTFVNAGWMDKKTAREYLKSTRAEFYIYAGDQAKRNAKFIANTTEKDITGILKRAMEKKGFLGDLVRDLVKDAESRSIYRAIVVGFTDIHVGLNFAQRKTAKDTQQKEYDYFKIWVTEKDEKVRDTHVVMEGVQVLTKDKFTVGGELMDGPGDDTVSIELWINCRCFLRYRRVKK